MRDLHAPEQPNIELVSFGSDDSPMVEVIRFDQPAESTPGIPPPPQTPRDDWLDRGNQVVWTVAIMLAVACTLFAVM